MVEKLDKYGEPWLDDRVARLFDFLRDGSLQEHTNTNLDKLASMYMDMRYMGKSGTREIVEFYDRLNPILTELNEAFENFISKSNEILTDRKYRKIESVKRSRRVTEGDASKKTNYAVQIRDMNTGYIHLYTGTKQACLELEKTLDDFTSNIQDIIDSGDQFEYESNMDWLNDEVLSKYGHIGEISYREIDENNNYWDYDKPYHIINDYYFDLYL